jgi:hypothetical protein
MEISRELAAKLSKYFINADPFMWGVLEAKNKKGRLKELKQLGLLANYKEGGNPLYSKINQDLLVELGIAGIIEKVVVPGVRKGFSPEILRYFRDCWNQGKTPDLDFLKKNKLYTRIRWLTKEAYEVRDSWDATTRVVGHKEPAFVFVQIDTQHNFVERWTVFAGLWFEEIEPLIQ